MRRQTRTLADRQARPLTRLLLGLLTWIVVLIFFFPVLWMALTGLKTEPDADTTTPHGPRLSWQTYESNIRPHG